MKQAETLSPLKIAIVIPTFRREHLLEMLIHDIETQVLYPNHLIIVDGDPATGKVRERLSALRPSFPITYVPSNHGNLSYQRYLGWCVAARLDMDILIYFDDDLRLTTSNILSYLVFPFSDDSVSGVGCSIRFARTNDGSDAARVRSEATKNPLVRILGSSRNVKPGGLTPTGHRILPIDDGREYAEVEWLHGGVMAYRMRSIDRETFSEDLFALDHVRCGIGEDTFLSRRVGAKGKLLYTYRISVDHPNADTPKSYPHDAYNYAFAVSYSRRFLNDHYRTYAYPDVRDRCALVKSYAGTTLLAWMRTLRQPSKINFSLAYGKTRGAIRGLTCRPTATTLTPHIDWWSDARSALIDVDIVHVGECEDE